MHRLQRQDRHQRKRLLRLDLPLSQLIHTRCNPLHRLELYQVLLLGQLMK